VWSIKRQDGQAWELAATLEHESPVWSCCFSVDGRVLVTGTKSSSITAWKVLPQGDFRKVEEEFKKAVDRKAKLEASMAEIKARVKQIGASLGTRLASHIENTKSRLPEIEVSCFMQAFSFHFVHPASM
jgi:WD40 repeat protein